MFASEEENLWKYLTPTSVLYWISCTGHHEAFFPVLLRNSWNISLYKFRAHTASWFDLHKLWNDYHNRFGPTSISHTYIIKRKERRKGKRKKCPPCYENSQDPLPWQLSSVSYGSISYSHHIHYIPRTYLSYNWKFVPFDHLPPSPPRPSPCPLHPLPLITTRIWSLFLRVWLAFFVVIFLDSTYKWDLTVFVSLSDSFHSRASVDTMVTCLRVFYCATIYWAAL